MAPLQHKTSFACKIQKTPACFWTRKRYAWERQLIHCMPNSLEQPETGPSLFHEKKGGSQTADQDARFSEEDDCQAQKHHQTTRFRFIPALLYRQPPLDPKLTMFDSPPFTGCCAPCGAGNGTCRTRNDDWRPRFVDEDRVHLVNNRKVEVTQHHAVPCLQSLPVRLLLQPQLFC